ncbi:MAG: hypothetical protein HAW60_05520 [Bdellovibrionales bacterium]|nr:hypothetical protein [Bdellovibrionales bacterium]
MIILNLFIIFWVGVGCSHFKGRGNFFNFSKVKRSFLGVGDKILVVGDGGYDFFYDKVCVYVKGGFDLGSGSTKFRVAKVDVCRGKILKVFLDQSVLVAYKENLVLVDGRFKFNKYIQDKGILVLKKMLKRAKKFNVDRFVGVGTSAFRKANNSLSFFARIKKELGINLRILTHKQEAEIGFLSAKVFLSQLKKSVVKNKKIIVWDIGGGSMQMFFKEKLKASNLFLQKSLIYKGNLASISFKNYIIKKIQKKSYKKSPNPIGSLTARKAEKYSFNYAQKTIPNNLKQIFKQKFLILGIGGVHYNSVFKQIKKTVNKKNKNYYTKYELQKTLNLRKNLSNKKIGGKYASTDVSNLILVLGFMKYLKINKIYTEKINLTNGVLLNF